jgi:hypothetical protein
MKTIRILESAAMVALVCLLLSSFVGTQSTLVTADNYPATHPSLMCPFAANCAELDPNLAPQSGPAGPWYVGHDEPSLLFYSNQPGSGNNYQTFFTLPTDPSTLPNQAGTAGTDTFQLSIAPWFGMALCDSQSGPTPGKACIPDSDKNIYDNPNPSSPNYLGNGPGVSFLEMQFYPPGWVAWPPGVSCSGTQWCAALNIDSYSQNMNTGQYNNPVCQAYGIEYVNFAFITTSGVPQPNSPPNPIQATLNTYTPNPNYDLFMNQGDVIKLLIHDTPNGVQVVLNDLTTGQSGSMTASAANGFGQELFAPNASTCTLVPYNFHPMYSTSSPNTRVVWAAHSYNVAFSDEIGHFEYCGSNAVQDTTDPYLGPTTTCVVKYSGDKDGSASGYEDDVECLGPNPTDSTNSYTSTKVDISGCIGYDPITGGDPDFDAVTYTHSWPGTATPAQDAALHPTPLEFTSFLFHNTATKSLDNYQRVAFENDLPRIELDVNNGPGATPCNRSTGYDCTDPPTPSWNGGNPVFYPIYTTTIEASQYLPTFISCVWQYGGNFNQYHPFQPNYPLHTFGGTAGSEFGTAFNPYYYPSSTSGHASVEYKMDDFRNILNYNACPSFEGFGGNAQ